MSTISDILDGIKTLLDPLKAASSPIQYVDIFTDIGTFRNAVDHNTNGVCIYYSGSDPIHPESSSKAIRRTYNVSLRLFDSSDRGYQERFTGFAGAPGLWKMEDDCIARVCGQQITNVAGIGGSATLPIRIGSTGEMAVDEDLSVWTVDLIVPASITTSF